MGYVDDGRRTSRAEPARPHPPLPRLAAWPRRWPAGAPSSTARSSPSTTTVARASSSSIAAQRRLGRPSSASSRSSAGLLRAFDVVWLDGEDLMKLTYEERRAGSRRSPLNGPAWQTPPTTAATARPCSMRLACAPRGRDGQAARQHVHARAALARVGEGQERARQELVVGGWCPGRGPAREPHRVSDARLLRRRPVRYAGNVGTGSPRRSSTAWRSCSSRCAAHEPFDPPPGIRKRCVFVEPEVVAEVEFNEWTRDGTLRQPSYKASGSTRIPMKL